MARLRGGCAEKAAVRDVPWERVRLAPDVLQQFCTSLAAVSSAATILLVGRFNSLLALPAVSDLSPAASRRPLSRARLWR